MKRTIRPNSRPAYPRRGVTLVEMLVTVAMLVIIMTILVQVFQAATGALTAAQTIQQLDDQLKLLDATIRSDLSNVTARFTPPLNPNQNLGYFEYGENEFADIQGEDSDDYIRFTAQAPPGRPFTGRMWVTTPPTSTANPEGAYFYNGNVQPVTVTSEYAEIIYFLRNGNLYRRVLLVAPELQSSIMPALSDSTKNLNTGYFLDPTTPLVSAPTITNTFTPGIFAGNAVSWQGVNDLSAHPAASGPSTTALASLPKAQQEGTQASQTIVLNTLGNLTNRENRAFYSRFANDFVTLGVANGAVSYTSGPDGLADDVDADNVPDYYPTLYPGILSPSNSNLGTTTTATWQLVFPPSGTAPQSATPLSLMGFPFVFPGAYSKAQALSSGDQCGWIHAPSPYAFVPSAGNNLAPTQFEASPLSYLPYMNHNPLDIGDNLPTENSGTVQGTLTPNQLQTTWWGFPTWRETLSPAWTDPTVQVNVGPVSLASAGTAAPAQPAGLALLTTAEVSAGAVNNYKATVSRALLPAMTSNWRSNPQFLSDTFGQDTNGNSYFFAAGNTLWSNLSWEDDLIMTGVRSFDVKAYDNTLGGYGDLGWGDDIRLYVPYSTYSGYLFSGNTPAVPTSPPGMIGTPVATVWPPVSTSSAVATLSTMAHEGRMPPLVNDLRADAQFGFSTYALPANNIYTGNIGDDNTGVVRLRRVWDTWSTEYSQAPGTGVFSGATGTNAATNGFPAGPPFTPPIYPSYPPPYPAPLRGIQIQIRVADPGSQRVKSITIRQDFTDKL